MNLENNQHKDRLLVSYILSVAVFFGDYVRIDNDPNTGAVIYHFHEL